MKKDYKKKLMKDVKVFLKKKKNKSNTNLVKDIKVYQKMKTNALLQL